MPRKILFGLAAVAIAITAAWLLTSETQDKCLASNSFLDCNMEITK